MNKLRGVAAIVPSLGLVLARAPEARAAADGERVAVVIIAESDPDLSDNLTEVAIAKLAQQRSDHRLVGLRELQAPLVTILGGRPLRDCVERPECLARIGAAAGAQTALLGEVSRERTRFVVQLWLADTSAGTHGAAFSDTVAADVKGLIAVVRTGVVALFPPKLAALDSRLVDQAPLPSRPLAELAPTPGVVREAAALEAPSGASARGQTRARGGGWLSAYGYAAGGVAMVTLSAAAVTGSLATEAPTGATRAAVQDDLERRDRYASAANRLYGLGGAIAVSALAAFLWRWLRD